MEKLNGRRVQSKRDRSLGTVKGEMIDGFITIAKDDGSEINIAESTFGRWWGKPDGKIQPAAKEEVKEVIQSTAEANKKKAKEKREAEKNKHTEVQEVIVATEKKLPKKDKVKTALEKIEKKKTEKTVKDFNVLAQEAAKRIKEEVKSAVKKSDSKKVKIGIPKKNQPKNKKTVAEASKSRVVTVPAYESKTGIAVRTLYKCITNSASGTWYDYAVDKVKKFNNKQKAELVKFIKAYPFNVERQDAFVKKYLKG